MGRLGTASTGPPHEDFLFRLQPGEPQRFLPMGTGSFATQYQVVQRGRWPHWGYDDLYMGTNGPPGGAHAFCDQGNTYAGSFNETCGGGGKWGRTGLEAWYPVMKGV